ncbi:autotransporter-associated beta strand repeat-containing protein [Dyella sp. OK004]|uniref:autotransporter-associated beta strand repeat-containing protein n=1 Tax=Dyella sp. OK004 TaxID=1855292 RepID=UPI0008F10677|nr:autotransporter-associated beta strand repeat-containing protein [Dyella sp. OK004]SFS06523.1 autotransporter-associated beta strand repeat-containing protein [Dyella sp. OK004]
MNRIYRLVWNRALRVLQVASELTRAHGGISTPAKAMQPRLARRLLALACLAVCAIPMESAMASCTPANPANGATVTCTGAANLLAPSYAASADNLTVNVQPGASAGVLLGLGGTAMSLTGNGTTLNNSGTIDPSLLGLLSLLSSGTVIGNPNLGSAIPGSTVVVDNQGTMKGTTGLLGLNLSDLTGMALSVRNGGGGTTTISNAGTIGSSALLGVSLFPADAPVIAAYGGAQVNFTNTGTVVGRTALESSAAGNRFINAGTISGSVSMGTNSTNTFTAVSGSNVNSGGSLGLNLLGVLGINLTFAPTGQIDGGAGGNNTLVLQNVVVGPGSGTGGPVTGASAGTYINFQHLTVNSGTWNLQGALVSGDATLNGGLANFDSDANFGSAPITANGGAIGASTNGSTLSKAITLNAGGLTAQVDNNFTLSGVLSGSGALTTNRTAIGTGTLTLAAANTYTGGTIIGSNSTVALGTSGSLAATGMLNLLGANAVFDISGASANQTIGTLVGAAGSQIALGARTLTLGDNINTTFLGGIAGTGGIVKQGTGVFTLAGANTYTGGTAIDAGTLAIGPGGSLASAGTVALNGAASIFDISSAAANPTIGALSGVAGSQVALGTHTLTLGDITSSTFAGTIGGTGGIVKQSSGMLTLSGANTYTGGTTINAGTLALGIGGSLSASGPVTLATGGIFDLSAAGAQTIGSLAGTGGTVNIGANTLTLAPAGSGTFGGAIAGSGGVVINGTGTQTLTGANAYAGGTSIQSGTLALGAGGSLAAGSSLTLAPAGTFDITAAGNQAIGVLTGGGGAIHLGANTLSVSGSGGGSFGGAIDGTGGLTNTANALVLNGTNTYTGTTQVQAGSLMVGGDAAHASATVGGDVTVASGASLGGFGIIGGSASVLAGGHLAPGNPTGTLTVSGGLTLAQGSLLDFSFGAPGPNFSTPGVGHNVAVGGNLTINGAAVNPIDAGGFGPGLYNLFTYGGTLTETNGGIAPPSGFTIQNLTASKQINLINTNGLTLNFWNANGLATNATMGGGSGTWAVPQTNWTDAVGSITSTRQPADAFAIFGGAPGTVTVDDGPGGSQPVTALGMQFASDGYLLNGGTIALVAPSPGALSEIRVGDGSAASAGWTATIDNTLTGLGINKTGAGTLVLNGSNAYTQGTMLSAGTLSVSADANLGAASAGLDFEGGTLRVTGTAFQSTSRAITMGAAGAGFDIADAANVFTVNPSLGGTGGLTKLGAGTLVLAGTNSYSGGTTISAGALQGDTTSLQGNITDNASLIFNQGANGGFGGAISGTGSLTKLGAGTLTLSGANSYSGGTTISAGALQGDTTSLQGNITDNASLIFNQGASGTFSGAVSGTGSLTKLGTGTLTLSGANSYSGGTTISAGALQGDSTSLQGNITDNASLIFNQGANGGFGGAISGTGSLTKLGAGTLTLSGANSYSGGTTISAGALQGDTTSLQGNITDNASLIFNQGTDGSFNGIVSGTGSLTKLGAGTLTLSRANSYSGGTTVSAGALQGDTTSLQGNITDNASLIFNQSANGSFGGVISGTGSLTKLGTGTLTLSGANSYSSGTTISAGTLQGDTTSLQGNIANNASLIFSQNSNGVFNGSLSGNGSLLKSGTGSLTFNGANPFIGAATVSAGTLIIGDNSHPNATLAGAVTVNSGAILGGIGTIGALDLSGAVVPGNTTGTLSVTGNAVFRNGSSYQVGATPAGQSSRIAIGGNASILGGSVLVLAQAGNYAPRTDYTILTAAQGVTGQFGAVSANLLFLTPVLSYTTNAVNLSLQRNNISFESVAETKNQKNTAGALDHLDPSSPVYDALLGLDAPTARHAFDQLSGEMHASTTTALFDDSHYVRDAINNHLLGANYGGQNAEGATASGTMVWSSLWGHWGDHDSDGNAHDMRANGSGLLVGADTAFDALRVGGVVGHGQNSLRVNEVGSSAHAKANYAGLYASWNLGSVRLRGGAAYAWQKIDTTRRMAFGPFSGVAQASYDANTAQAYVDGSYVFEFGRGTLEPYLNLSQVHVRTDAFTEHGTPAALAVDKSSSNLTAAIAGVRGTMELAPGGLHAYAGVGYQHAWGDRVPERQQRFVAGADNFTVYGVPVADNAAVFDLGLRFPLSHRVTVDFGYHGQFASDARDQSARLTVNVAF